MMATSESNPQPRKRWRYKWLLLALVLACCCATPVAWIPATASVGRKATRLHEQLRAGMSVAEVLARVDEVQLSGLTLSRVFLFPRVAGQSEAAQEREDAGCPVTAMVWSPVGNPWQRDAAEIPRDVFL